MFFIAQVEKTTCKDINSGCAIGAGFGYCTGSVSEFFLWKKIVKNLVAFSRVHRKNAKINSHLRIDIKSKDWIIALTQNIKLTFKNIVLLLVSSVNVSVDIFVELDYIYIGTRAIWKVKPKQVRKYFVWEAEKSLEVIHYSCQLRIWQISMILVLIIII